ncbi:MAG: hypothetical protein EA398_01615 [Deltaproteobacteria bacterium]|nr:MAG: hypothetical protein EA398_01615 [Deltaproteobacteria bacterium]
MWTRLVRFRRAKEARRILEQQVWEIGGEEASDDAFRGIIPTVLEPLRPDTELQRNVRSLLEVRNVDAALALLREQSSMKLFLTVLYGAQLLTVLFVVGFLLLSLGPGSEPVTVSNAGRYCADELERGLVANAEARDFHYDVGRADVADLMEQGRVVLGYFRDGIPVEVHYRLSLGDGECRLVAWQVRRDLGQRWEGARGEFGSVVLRDCVCE